MRAVFSLVVAALFLSGCSIAPLPEDVTGYTAHRIVRKIRCETRRAVAHQLGQYLKDYGELRGDPRATVIGDNIIADQEDLRSVDLTFLDRHAKVLLTGYIDTAIAYNFSLTGLEDNNLGGQSNTVNGILSGSRSLLVAGNLDRSRQTVQTFTISDTFAGLLRKMDPEYCKDQIGGPNYLYPITGEVGMRKLVNDFVNLVQFDQLVADAKEKPGAPPTFTTNLTFKTAVGASANPIIAISPILGATRTGGTFTGLFRRTDTHTLIVAFARPLKSVSEARAVRVFSGEIISPSGTETEQRAQLAIQQSIIRYELNNNRPAGVVINQGLIAF